MRNDHLVGISIHYLTGAYPDYADACKKSQKSLAWLRSTLNAYRSKEIPKEGFEVRAVLD
jgi:hypothetical protein